MSTAVNPVPVLEAMPTRDAPRAAVATPSAPAVESNPEPTYRLVIEESGPGSFVYKTLDRVTGEVVRQIPREEVVRMMSEETYRPGDVIDTGA